MKPAAVINQGDSFVTLRATTESPAEIREALQARDVQHVFKGDQNQAWDAVLANHCLARAVGDSDAEITFFVQDERLGTSDARLARAHRQAGRRYVLTEDYYRGRAGAVWEHQDVSHGLFFTEAVSPEQFAEAGIHLHRAAELWETHHAAALADPEWLAALASLGVTFPGLSPAGADAATRLGPAVDADTLAHSFADGPSAGLYYAFTKTDGLYGLVPVENDNVTLSSIPFGDPEVRAAWTRLLTGAAAAGAMRLAATPAHRRGVKNRARKVAEWAQRWSEAHPNGSIADFQAALGSWLTAEIFPADRLEMDRSSHLTRIDTETLPRLKHPAAGFHFFLDLALRHPAEFTEAYNEALNRVGYGLQRMKYDPVSGFYTPPFFVEWAPGGPGTPVYRYSLQLSGTGPTRITLGNAAAGDLELAAPGGIRSAYELGCALTELLPHTEGLAIIGKAAALAAELQRSPRGLGLPRQGSKYAPMVDHFVSGLRARGVLDRPTGLLIRIGLNALDRLNAMGEMRLRLPRFLEGPLGAEISCRELAGRWRGVAQDAREQLRLLSRCEVGQHVHLARLLCLNARGAAPDPADRRLAKLVRALGSRGRELGLGEPAAAFQCMERLIRRRDGLLQERRAVVSAAQTNHAGGRLCPDPERMAELDRERSLIDLQLQLLVAAWIRRLWQRAESLPYLNDRPYTLALYLLFGSDIFGPICRNVEFDVEYVSPTLDHAPLEAAAEAELAAPVR